MRTIEAGKGLKPNTRLDNYLLSTFPALSKNALYKAFRKKDVKIAGKWAASDSFVVPGAKISVYLPDGVLFGSTGAKTGAPASSGFSVVYEDSRLLVANKARGIPVHPDKYGNGASLIELAREYLINGDRSRTPLSASASVPTPTPALCHRLDRNTSGLVLIAKDGDTLRLILDKLAAGKITKEYRCIVTGKPSPPESTLKAYLLKNTRIGKVSVFDEPAGVPDFARAQKIVTRYRLLRYDHAGDTSKLEVSLLTGRTHQIRAHLAHIGHPIIGDGKYCQNAINERYGVSGQLLTAFRLTFAEKGYDGDSRDGYLSGAVFEIPDNLSHPSPR